MFRPVPSFVHHRALEFRVGIPTRSIDSEFAFRVYMYRIQCIRIKRFRTGSETAGLFYKTTFLSCCMLSVVRCIVVPRISV